MAATSAAAAAVLSLLVASSVRTATIDQRQDGEVNVNVDVRNVEVLAVLGDYGSYEYEDYEDPEDPESGWTGGGGGSDQTPSSSTTASTTTSTTEAPDVSVVLGTALDSPNAKPTVAAALADDPDAPSEEGETSASTPTNATPTASTPGRRRCDVGFYRDRLGRCRRVPPTMLDFPFGFRVAPKFRREKIKETGHTGTH